MTTPTLSVVAGPAALPPHLPLPEYCSFDDTAPDCERIEHVLALGPGYRRQALLRGGLAAG